MLHAKYKTKFFQEQLLYGILLDSSYSTKTQFTNKSIGNRHLRHLVTIKSDGYFHLIKE